MEPATDQETSPVQKLYRHALESIFHFCPIEELHPLLAVNREWSAAVVSMPSIRASQRVESTADLLLVAQSRLGRHVSKVDGDYASSLEGLRILAERLPWMDHYRFQLTAENVPSYEDCAVALARLCRLKTLELCLTHSTQLFHPIPEYSALVNRFLEATGTLQHLECLEVRPLHCDSEVRFAPLAALPRLRSLQVFTRKPGAAPSDEQVAAIRQMHSLESLQHDFTDRNGTLRLLLQSPTPPLRWKSAGVASGAADLVPQLLSLSELSALNVECRCGDVEFLTSLPRVLSLTLHRLDGCKDEAADLTRIVTALQHCPQLTLLTLNGLAFTSAQLASMLPALPRLTELNLHYLSQLTSLSFLAADALVASLVSVSVWMCSQVPSTEIVHLLGLRSLRSLDLYGLRDILSPAQKAQLQSLRLPSFYAF